MNKVKGYKVFNPDWTCRNKAYTCPGKFEENVTPSIYNEGMHFCKKMADCFNYVNFNPANKVAEVVAYGTVMEADDKCCTDKLEIVREIPWSELLEKINTGEGCTGLNNSGDYNSGNCNSGDYNSGNCNSGDYNSGYWNSGNYNRGGCNSGGCNSGDRNRGYGNSGSYNSGDHNSGNHNSGNYNSGNYNSGNYNSGNYNSGNYNSGICNSGDWNKCNFSNGCFNTVSPKINIFNKPSNWTYEDWVSSDAYYLLKQIPVNTSKYIKYSNMTDEEKAAHPEAKTTDGYIKILDNSEYAVIWWRELSKHEKAIITAIPNFDKKIFKDITGIDVED